MVSETTGKMPGKINMFTWPPAMAAFKMYGTHDLPYTMYVTYTDLIQIGIFIVALVGLCYQIFKGKRK